jgi:hypothetical protein
MAGETHHGGEFLRPEPQLVSELSPEALVAMKENFDQNGGKFLRIGPDIILITPLYSGSHDSRVFIYHRQIIRMLVESADEELKRRVQLAQSIAAGQGPREKGSAVADAGRFFFNLDDNDKVSNFIIEGSSEHYGIASVQARAQTAEVARRRLGEGVRLTVSEI